MMLDAVTVKQITSSVQAAVKGRELVGYDLREPAGFSHYLHAAYVQKKVPTIDSLVSEAFKSTEGQGTWGQRYALIFKAFNRATAPQGMCIARGMHSVGFQPGDDIARAGKPLGSVDNYSQNIVIASSMFSTNYLNRSPNNRLQGSWLRVARTLHERGLSEREAVRLSQNAVVLVAQASVEDLAEWGGDSESGETYEAEVKATCAPKCVRHVFVASTRPLGRAVPADAARYYGLDAHIETSFKNSYGSQQTLYLHLETKAKGKTVKHLPDEWKWYEVAR